jgi:hypothetical protein
MRCAHRAGEAGAAQHADLITASRPEKRGRVPSGGTQPRLVARTKSDLDLIQGRNDMPDSVDRVRRGPLAQWAT